MAAELPSLLLFLFLHLASAQPQTPLLTSLDFAVLADIKQSLRDLPGSNFLSTWNFNSPSAISDACISFSGVLCSPSDDLSTLRVTSLSLGSISGRLPPSLSNFSLSSLTAAPGKISGPLPPLSVRLLSLSGNLISGEIPNFSDLHTLDLSHNLLSGEIPNGLLSLPSLRVLILSSNNLAGEIPAVTAPLLHLDLRANNLTGGIPPLPSSLRYISLCRNHLTGTLQSLSSPFPDLAYVDISFNGFSGPVPGSLFDPRRPIEDQVPPPLTILLLQRNNLSGEIPVPILPSAIEKWTVDFSHNHLSGAIPPELAEVESLFLNHNRLTGAVPHEIVRSLYEGEMTTFYVQHNFLSAVEWAAPLPALPEGVTACLAFNCAGISPEGPSGCPAGGGGRRPAYQCTAAEHGVFILDEDET